CECPTLAFVASSRGSTPASAPSRAAASLTLRAIGPAVSCDAEIGMIADRPHNPTVGFTPTSPFADEGLRIDPSVSVPIPTVARCAAMATPVPELDPEGLRSRAYG